MKWVKDSKTKSMLIRDINEKYDINTVHESQSPEAQLPYKVKSSNWEKTEENLKKERKKERKYA